jgi:hypothetical protein
MGHLLASQVVLSASRAIASARGEIVGDSYGMLKCCASRLRTASASRALVRNQRHRAHRVGHHGLHDYLVDTVLNYPTLSVPH